MSLGKDLTFVWQENKSNWSLQISLSKTGAVSQIQLSFYKTIHHSVSFSQLIDRCTNSCSLSELASVKDICCVTLSHPMPGPWLDLWWLLYQASHKQTWKDETPFLFQVRKVLWYIVWTRAGCTKHYDFKEQKKCIYHLFSKQHDKAR